MLEDNLSNCKRHFAKIWFRNERQYSPSSKHSTPLRLIDIGLEACSGFRYDDVVLSFFLSILGEFEMTFAAATALRTLVSELNEVAPNYLADLRLRIEHAVSQGEAWTQDYPSEEIWDEFVPLQAALGAPSVTSIPWQAAVPLTET